MPQNTITHVKLQNDDFTFQDAMYHWNCLTNLYNKASAKQLEAHYTDKEGN